MLAANHKDAIEYFNIFKMFWVYDRQKKADTTSGGIGLNCIVVEN